jgi:hypothetical protein
MAEADHKASGVEAPCDETGVGTAMAPSSSQLLHVTGTGYIHEME